MKVNRTYLTSQIDVHHKRFVSALKELREASGLQRELLIQDLADAHQSAVELMDKYSAYVDGPHKVMLVHMTSRSIQQWIAFLKIDNAKKNLITTSL